MASHFSEHLNTFVSSDQATHRLPSGAVMDTHSAQQPICQESIDQAIAENVAKTFDEVVRTVNPISDLSELWKLSAYKQLEGWRRSGP